MSRLYSAGTPEAKGLFSDKPLAILKSQPDAIEKYGVIPECCNCSGIDQAVAEDNEVSFYENFVKLDATMFESIWCCCLKINLCLPSQMVTFIPRHQLLSIEYAKQTNFKYCMGLVPCVCCFFCCKECQDQRAFVRLEYIENDAKTKGVHEVSMGSANVADMNIEALNDYVLKPITQKFSQKAQGDYSFLDSLGLFTYAKRWGLIQEETKGENPQNIIQQMKTLETSSVTAPMLSVE